MCIIYAKSKTNIYRFLVLKEKTICYLVITFMISRVFHLNFLLKFATTNTPSVKTKAKHVIEKDE